MDKTGQSTDTSRGLTRPPTVDELASDLKLVVRLGLRVSKLSENRLRLSALFSLPTVEDLDRQGDDAAARRVVQLVRLALAQFRAEDADLADGLSRLVGSSDAASTLSPVERRASAARVLVGWDQQPESFLKRQQPKFCALLAERLLRVALSESGDPEFAWDQVDPILVPKGVEHITIEQQMYLRMDSEYYVRTLDQFNTIRYEVPGPFDVKRQFSFYDTFEDPKVAALTPATSLAVDDGFVEGLHIRIQVPSLPAGSIHTFGFRLTTRGGPLNYFTVISQRTMRAVSLVLDFETAPEHVWLAGPVDTPLDLPNRMPSDAEPLLPSIDGLFVARFVSPQASKHVGIAWELEDSAGA